MKKEYDFTDGVKNPYTKKIKKQVTININDLEKPNNGPFIDFRYFRNNLLSELKRNDQVSFIESIIEKREIDYYYKNNGKEYALYLLALIDYLCRINKIPVYTKRYNDLRKEKLEKPFFVGGNSLSFTTIEEAEQSLQITIIPEFKRFNIIENDIFNVA